MATLDQWIGYTQVASDFLQKAKEMREMVDELGSDPLGVLSVVNLEGLLETPVAKRLPVVKMHTGVITEKVVPKAATRLPDVDLPTPRGGMRMRDPEDWDESVVKKQSSVVDELLPTPKEENEQLAEEAQARPPSGGGRIASKDENVSYETTEPRERKRMLSGETINGVAVTRQTAKAIEFLYAALADGPRPRVLIVEDAKKVGISEYAIQEARRYTSDIKTKIIGARGMHWFYMVGQEAQLPSRNGDDKKIVAEAASDRGLRPDEVKVLTQLPGSVAELIGRSGLAPQKVKDILEFLLRRKLALLDKGANVWRPTEVAASV